MKTEYFGHSCFRITTKQGYTLVFDPYTQIGYELPSGLTADILLCSHEHFDHAYTDGVRAKRIVFGAGEYNFEGIKITGFSTYHDDAQGKKRGGNTVFLVEADGVKLCHLGDFGEKTLGALKEKLTGLDVLFIPIGGTYTIDAKAAKCIVDELKPVCVVPMHFKTPDFSIEIADEKEFLSFYPTDETAFVGGEWEYEGRQKKIIRMERKKR